MENADFSGRSQQHFVAALLWSSKTEIDSESVSPMAKKFRSGHPALLALNHTGMIVSLRGRIAGCLRQMRDEMRLKRACDFVASAMGLILFSPIIGLLALAIRAESKGPAIFAQQRVGRDGVPFTCYKLRSMFVHAENVPTHELVATRITRIGRLLRKLKLDELPQLYNVLRGDMSLVGPRPCLPSQEELIELRRSNGALALAPGITGLAQIQGVDMAVPEKLAAIDGQYARTMSLYGDLKILLRTVSGGGLGRDAVSDSETAL